MKCWKNRSDAGIQKKAIECRAMQIGIWVIKMRGENPGASQEMDSILLSHTTNPRNGTARVLLWRNRDISPDEMPLRLRDCIGNGKHIEHILYVIQ